MILPVAYMRPARTITPLLFVLLACLTPFVPRTACAASELTVTPVVIDEKAKPGDILNETITITNATNHVLGIYPEVNDVHQTDGTQPFQAAQNAVQASDSLSNWIELSRGLIQLDPGESKAVPFIIRVTNNAVTAPYHATVTFGDGMTGDGPSGSSKHPLGTVTVNLDLQREVKELMQLNKFVADNVVFSGDDVLFKYQLQNIGNQELDPKGEIRIYDRKGEEVASVDVNRDGKVVSPDQVAQLASVWAGASGFGKYKALIDVTYGKNQVASVQDVAYFWVIPWKQVLGMTIVTLVSVIALALYFHRWLEDRHLGKLATAGLLSAEAMLHIQPHQEERPAPIVARPVATVIEESRRSDPAKEKRSFFSRFKRRERTSESAVTAAVAAPEVVRVAPAIAQPTIIIRSEPKPAQPAASATIVMRPQTQSTQASGAIDLKKMWKPAAPSVSENHVINLKMK